MDHDTTLNFLLLATAPKAYTQQRIMEELTKCKVEFEVLIPQDYPLELLSKRPIKSLILSRIPGQSYDDYDLCVLKYFEGQGCPSFNHSNSLKRLRGKIDQLLFFKHKNFPIIPTLALRNVRSSLAAIDTWQATSFILKTERGYGGRGAMLLEGKKNLMQTLDYLETTGDLRFILQPYLANCREWRYLILKGEVISCLQRRSREGDFRSNMSMGGLCQVQSCDSGPAALALQSFKESKLFYGSVEILEDAQGQFYLLEVNGVPGLEQAEKEMDQNLTKIILQSILRESLV